MRYIEAHIDIGIHFFVNSICSSHRFRYLILPEYKVLAAPKIYIELDLTSLVPLNFISSALNLIPIFCITTSVNGI